MEWKHLLGQYQIINKMTLYFPNLISLLVGNKFIIHKNMFGVGAEWRHLLFFNAPEDPLQERSK
jgi:hypothetical protein